MKKKIKLLSKLLSLFLALVLVTQLAPMQVLASIYHDITADENTDNLLGVSLEDIDTVQPEAEILAEDNSKREQSVKHFLMSDGSYKAAQYDVPVHFMQNNEWTDYDNTLVEVDADSEDGEPASNKDLTNVLSDYSVRLSKKTNGKKFVRIEKDGYKLSWYYTKSNKVTAKIFGNTDDGDNTTLEKLSSQVIYEDVYKDTDFEYIVSSEGLKENIILKSRNTQTVFEAEYKANGLTPVQIDDKTIELKTDTGTVIYVISAPCMIDANMEFSDGITLSLSDVKNNKFTITITLDENWLNELSRAYPVTVDPYLQTSQKWEDAACNSAYIASSTPNTCYGRGGSGYEGSLYVGKTNNRGKTRSLIKLSKLPDLGIADKVVYAEMAVWTYACYPELTINLHNVTSSWNQSTVCWNSNIQYDSSITDYQTVQHIEETNLNADRWQIFEITDLVRGWYSGEIANNGVMLRSEKENNSSQARAWLFSSGYTSYSQVRPVFVIHYRNMSGYEDYWSYTGISAGRGGAVSVNNYNGNAVFSQPLTLGDGGNLMPVSISLVYNSNGDDAPYSLFGKKMRTNFHLNIGKEDNTDLYDKGYRYYLVDADGTKHWFYFENSTTKTGKDEDGLGYTLDVIAKGSDSTCTDAIFRITDKDKTKMYFDSENQLIQITNTNNVSIKVTYSTNPTLIKTITDGAGRVYTYNYEDTANPQYCTSITDPAGRKTSFEYTDGNMTKITFPDKKACSLSYDNENNDELLTRITSIDGTRAQIQYNDEDQYRVTNINWGTSDTALLENYSFEYKQNETTITEHFSGPVNRKYTYQFNDFGQTTGIVSNESGMAQYFEYTSPEKIGSANANKLVSESKIIHSVANFIKNPGVVNALSGTYDTDIESKTGTPTITQDTTKGHLTKNSIKVYKPASNTGYVYATQSHTGLSDGTYTFSCYANTYNETITGEGLYVGYRILDSNGTIVKSGSAESTNTTDGWERISVTFDVDINQTVKILVGFSNGSFDGSGTVWFDDLQLEKSAGVSSYNLLENSVFSNGLKRWSTSATVNTITDLPGYSKSISKTGEPTSQWLGLSQLIYTVPDAGKKGDVFSIGSWIKANSAPINNLKKNDTYSPRFALALHFYDSNDTCVGTEEIAVNDDLVTWQFVSGKVIAPVDYHHLCFEVIYYSNVNTIAMTGGFCYKEEFGHTYDYDDNGNVTSVVDLSNSKSSFAFKGDQMAKLLNPSGSRYLYSYDSKNNLNYALSSDGQEYSFEYDDKGNVTNSEISARTPVTSLETNVEYMIVNAFSGKALDSGNSGKLSDDTVTSSYNPESIYQHWKLAATDTSNVYKIVPVAFPQFHLDIQGGYSDDGRVLQIYTPNTNTNQKFKITKNNEENTFTIYTGCTSYSKAIDAQYDNKNLDTDQVAKQKTVVSSNLGESVKWYFYPVNKTDDKMISTSVTYDNSKNFVSSMTDQRCNVTNYNYNESKGTLSRVTDAKGYKTSYYYNNYTNALVSVLREDDLDMVENYYTYENDRLSQISTVSGTNYKFIYDSYGRTTATQVGRGTNYQNLSALEYDNKGLMNKQIYGNGDFIGFTYDNLDRLTEKRYNNSDIDKIRYQYGANGNLASTIDFSTNTETKYVYDLAGRIVGTKDYLYGNTTSSIPQLKASINYHYADKTNYLIGITHKFALGTKSIGYRYGNVANGEMPDQIYGVTWNGKQALNYTYDSLGRLSKKSLPLYGNDPYDETFDTTYTYYDVNDTKTTTMLKSLSSMGITHTYEYDELGNITSIYDGSEYNTYEYDYLGQLVRENLGYEDKTYTYEYVNGNIKYKHEYAYTTGTLPSNPLRTINYHYENSLWPDMLTKITETTYSGSYSSAYSLNNVSSTGANALASRLFGGNYNVVDLKENAIVNVGSNQEANTSNASTRSTSSTTSTLYTIGSDAIGNITNVGNVTLDWNGRRLESISQAGTELVSYEYNMDGQRTKKIVTDPTTGTTTTTEYFYNGSILAGQKTGNDEIVFMYDNNGDVFGFEYNGTPYYYVKNAQNDVYLILDENGYAQVLYQYDAWGNVTYAVDATDFGLAGKNPIMYRSYYVDLEMGMFIYYLNSRYYVAEWGRFASADVLVSSEQGMLGYNLFAYCGNNPVNRSDTGGAFWDTLFDVVSLCTSIVDVISNPRDPWAWAGLVGDVIDLAVPGLSGVGEVVKGARTAGKVVDGVSAVGNTARKVNNLGDAGQTVNKLHRPYIRKSVRDIVESRAVKTSNGLFLDANTRTPIVGKYDLGHVYGHEFWRERDLAMSKGWSQKQFNDYMNNPDFYQIEEPKYNRAHIFEMR